MAEPHGSGQPHTGQSRSEQSRSEQSRSEQPYTEQPHKEQPWWQRYRRYRPTTPAVPLRCAEPDAGWDLMSEHGDPGIRLPVPRHSAENHRG